MNDDNERIRALQAQVDRLVTLVAAQERLIEQYRDLVEILKQGLHA